MKVVVAQGQSLLDIAMQVYGSADAVYTLAKDNAKSVTDILSVGEELSYSSDNMVDARVARYFATNEISPSTAFAGALPSDNRLFDSSFDETFN